MQGANQISAAGFVHFCFGRIDSDTDNVLVVVKMKLQPLFMLTFINFFLALDS